MNLKQKNKEEILISSLFYLRYYPITKGYKIFYSVTTVKGISTETSL